MTNPRAHGLPALARNRLALTGSCVAILVLMLSSAIIVGRSDGALDEERATGIEAPGHVASATQALDAPAPTFAIASDASAPAAPTPLEAFGGPGVGSVVDAPAMVGELTPKQAKKLEKLVAKLEAKQALKATAEETLASEQVQLDEAYLALADALALPENTPDEIKAKKAAIKQAKALIAKLTKSIAKWHKKIKKYDKKIETLTAKIEALVPDYFEDQTLAAPAAPEDVVASVVGSTSVSLAWSDVEGALAYDIYWDTSPGVTPESGTLIAGATSPYLHTGLTQGNTYYYVVAARNDAGMGPPSYEASAFLPASTPTISTIAGQTTNEDTATGPISFTVGDEDTPLASLTLSGSSSNPALVPKGNLVFAGSGADRTVTATPTPNKNGSTVITVTVSDGDLTASTSFVLQVTAVNDAPTISSLAPQTTVAGTPVGPLAVTVGDAETSAFSLTLSGSSSNPTLVPTGNIVFGGSGANRTVTVTPAAGKTGSATITATVSDGSLTSSSSFLLTVNASASIGLVAAYGFGEGSGSAVADASGNGNAGTLNGATWTTAGKFGGALSFNGSSAKVTINDSATLDLTTQMTLEAWVNPSTVTSAWRDVIYKGDDNYYLEATSLNGGLPAMGGKFSSAPLYGPAALAANAWTHLAATYDGASERLYVNGVQVASHPQTGTIQTSANPLQIGGDGFYGQYFQGMIDEVRVYDRALAASEVLADMNSPIQTVGNTAPTISAIGPQATSEDTAAGPIGFTVGDAETAPGSLTLSGSSSNATLVPSAGIVFGGSGANRTVTLTPALNQNGAATITVTVSDGSLTDTSSFVLTVNAVNDAPTISDIADQTTVKGTAVGPLAVTVGDVETAAAALTLSGSSSNPALVPVASIVFGGSGANRTVTVTPAAGLTGTATITVAVSDGSASSNTSFLLTVIASNHAPTISTIAGQSTNEDTPKGPIGFTVDDQDTPAASLTVSGTSSNPTLVPGGGITFGGSGANRTVTLTPAANKNGSATITVTVSDGSLTGSTSFALVVTAVNDAPTISSLADQTTPVGTAVGPLAVTVGDVETAAASLTLSGTSSNLQLVPTANIVLGGTGANHTVTVTPVAGQTGTATITVAVSDGSLTDNSDMQLTVGASANENSPLGMNLGGLTYYAPDWAFTDAMKQSQLWLPQQASGWEWDTGIPLAVDSDGWPILKPGEAAGTLMYRSIGGHYPTGDYVCLYDGEGTIEFGFDAHIVSQTPGHIVVNVSSPTDEGIYLKITASNPANHVRNVRLMLPGFETSTEVFHPLFLQRLAPFKVIRFMDWGRTNNSENKDWAARNTTHSQTQGDPRGVALEYMIDLCNAIGADPWVCIPHLATDDYVTQFATMVRDQLNPTSKVYIEYSNETWNSMFAQNQYCINQGLALGLDPNQWYAGWKYHSQRSVQIFNIFENVFGGTSRLVRVLGAQESVPFAGAMIMDWQNAYQHSDALAGAPYFEGGLSANPGVINMTVPQMLAAISAGIASDLQGAIAQNIANADARGLKYVAYEGGQGLQAIGVNLNNAAVTAKFIALQHDPGMYDLYMQFLNGWKAGGGDMFNQYTLLGTYSQYGTWGSMEYTDQNPSKATSPKYAPLVDFIKQVQAGP